MNQERLQGFSCLWGCGGEHCLGDCGVDVLLQKLGEVYRGVFVDGSGDRDEGPDKADGRDSIRVTWRGKNQEEKRKTAVVRKGYLLEEIYGLVQSGRLEYNASEVTYRSGDMDSDTEAEIMNDNNVYTARDGIIFDKLVANLRNELDCQICYSLILDPLTTPCGHTFCRECLAGMLHHSDLCPICRRTMYLPSTVKSEPLNERVNRLSQLFYPDQIDARREEVAPRIEFGLNNGRLLPLFVCALAFPTMPTFLHIFEPRYRLMIQRVMDSGEGEFGMLMYNRSGQRQGELGRSQYMQYGTLLVVDRFELLPDGRSIVLATGWSRFKVVQGEILDGYHVGKIERVDDVSLAEEERVESTETAAALAVNSATPAPQSEDSINDHGNGENRNSTNNSTSLDDLPLESMSTQQLLQAGLDFVEKQRFGGITWLQPRALLAYGDMPTDAVRFPWWLASILRIPEEDKYPLLLATSVRERLKITASWARKLESNDW